MKDFSFETIFTSLRNDLITFLKENFYSFELAGNTGDYHFIITTNDEGARKINDFLDTRSLTEERQEKIMSKGKSSMAIVMTAVMAQLIKVENLKHHRTSPVYFPAKRSLRGNCKIRN